MNRNRQVLVTFLMILTVLFTESAVARLQKDARECIKPRFSKFTPPRLTEVAPNSTISFVANHSTSQATIEVTAKGIKIPKLRITDKNSFYVIEFELPKSLVGTYARLHIKARAKVGLSNCKHRDGWLLKIAGNQAIPTAPLSTKTQTPPPITGSATAVPITNKIKRK